jgi:hypothetical protein
LVAVYGCDYCFATHFRPWDSSDRVVWAMVLVVSGLSLTFSSAGAALRRLRPFQHRVLVASLHREGMPLVPETMAAHLGRFASC